MLITPTLFKFKKFKKKLVFKITKKLNDKMLLSKFLKTARTGYKVYGPQFKNFYALYIKNPKSTSKIFYQQRFEEFKLLCFRRFSRYKNLKLQQSLYPKMNSKYYWNGPKRALEYVLPKITQYELKSKNFFRKRYNQMAPNQKFRKRILAHYYLRFARHALFCKNIKQRDIITNFFSLDRKLLRIYAHRVEKFVYKRFPYKMKTFKTNFYFPNFSNYRYLFKNQIREQHTFRWLRRLTYKQLVKMFKKATFHTKRQFERAFLKYLELRLDTAIYRLNIAFSVNQAKHWVKKGFFLVNDTAMCWHKFQLNIGDVIMPIKELRSQHWPQHIWTADFGVMYNSIRLFWRPIQAGQYPGHFLVNERIPCAIVITNVDVNTVYDRRPVSIQFLTLSLLKYS